MKEKNSNRGITLKAWMITVIVMLILAGVTINLTLGENGIFTTAGKAAKNYTDAQNKEMADIDNFTNIVDKTIHSLQNNYEIAGTIIKTENNINYTADGAGNIIPVPVGFSPLTTKEQGTKYTGFVIKNDIDGNEFVWVPVEGMSYTYNRYAMLENQPEYELDTDTESIKIKYDTSSSEYFTEKKLNDEETSVATYGGYYIGRYEAGIVGGEKEDTITEGTYYTGDNMKLVVKANQQVWNNITKQRASQESTNLYNKTEDNVMSKLCSSYAWDTALKFIETQDKNYPTDSNGGNYNTATGGTGKLQHTGYNAVNNIYDMGGNTWEWTTESYSDTMYTCVPRGGSYSTNASDNPAASRRYNVTGLANEYVSFRVTLFI